MLVASEHKGNVYGVWCGAWCASSKHSREHEMTCDMSSSFHACVYVALGANVASISWPRARAHVHPRDVLSDPKKSSVSGRKWTREWEWEWI